MEYIKKDPRIFEEQTFGYPNSTSCLYSNVYDTFDVMILLLDKYVRITKIVTSIKITLTLQNKFF